jgi:hypothetical protein
MPLRSHAKENAMKRIPVLLALAGAVLATPALADLTTYYLWDPVTRTYVERTVDRPAENTQPLPVYTYPAPPSTTYVAPSTTYVAPATTTTYIEPAGAPYPGPDIIVTAPRMTEDQLITRDVVDRIATNPNISGRIGVETYNRDVTLTGRTVTQGQADRAEREAKSVAGVDDVNNLIRPRVGGQF